jgi:Ankyrin repeats (3 copies)
LSTPYSRLLQYRNWIERRRLSYHIDRGVSELTRDGETPLHYAATKGDKEVVELLLDAGANIDGRDTQGWTALHKAAHQGSQEVVELLLRKGAVSSKKTKSGQTAQALAHNNKVRELLEHHLATAEPSANYKDDSRTTSISSARELQAATMYPKMISNLINTGDVYFEGLRTKGVGRTGQLRSQKVLLIYAALLKIFGPRLKDETANAEQMASANTVIAHWNHIASVIEEVCDIRRMDGSVASEIKPDDNQEARVVAFLKQRVQDDKVLDRVPLQILHQTSENGLGKVGHNNVSVTTSLHSQKVKRFLTSSRAFMELCVSFRRLMYPDVLRAIHAELSRCDIKTLKSKFECHATLLLEWNLWSFLVDEIEGEMEVTEKVQVLWSVITATGESDRAWATTCKEYVTWRWPGTAQAVMCAVQNSICKMSEDGFWKETNTRSSVWSGKLPRTSDLKAGMSKQ